MFPIFVTMTFDPGSWNLDPCTWSLGPGTFDLDSWILDPCSIMRSEFILRLSIFYYWE